MVLERFLRGWAYFTRALQTTSQVVRPCRLSLAVALLGGWVIVGVVQSGEGLASLCDKFGRLGFAVFALATIWWGWTSWYLARSMLRFAFPDSVPIPPENQRLHGRLTRWLPRVLGIAPVACVTIAIGRCPAQPGAAFGPSATMAILALLFALFLNFRKGLLVRLRDRLERPDSGELLKSVWQDLDQLYEATFTHLSQLPKITRWVLLSHVAISLLFFFLFVFFPVSFAQWLGAPTVLILSLATWVACGSIVTYTSSKIRAPLSLVLLATAFTLSGFVDNHVAEPREASAAPLRQKLADDFAQWRRRIGDDQPFIVVATEGGGIRAAYWTAAVLAGIQDQEPKFQSHLYAISSVSGGSLGAATFEALLAGADRTQFQKRAAEILGNDFLAPPLARMLYTDLVQRFLPVSIPRLDRGVALEAAWTDAFERKNVTSFSKPFDAFWVEHPDLPRLFLNSTWVEKGSRVVLSYPILEPSNDVTDGDTLATFSFAQAVHASARFPYISPAEAIPGKRGTWGHLVDGGYFENSGAVTAKEILDLAATGVPQAEPSVTEASGDRAPRCVAPKRSTARVIIIRYCDPGKTGEHAARWASELTAPPLTFFAARDARGTLAIKTLKRAFADTDVAEFCLWTREHQPELPLGWMLSQTAQKEIDEQADVALGERGPAAKVYDWLK